MDAAAVKEISQYAYVDTKIFMGRWRDRGYTVTIAFARCDTQEVERPRSSTWVAPHRLVFAPSNRDLDACWSSRTWCHIHGSNAKSEEKKQEVAQQPPEGAGERDSHLEQRAAKHICKKKEPTSEPVPQRQTERRGKAKKTECTGLVSSWKKWKLTYSCRKGNSVNQDSFSATRFHDGWEVFCVMDGHGSDGHLVSSRLAQTVPYYLLSLLPCHDEFPHQDAAKFVQDALKKAFKLANVDLLAQAKVAKFDVCMSGSTCVVAVRNSRGDIWSACLGDCQLVANDGQEIYKTVVHRLDNPDEKQRIVDCLAVDQGRVKAWIDAPISDEEEKCIGPKKEVVWRKVPRSTNMVTIEPTRAFGDLHFATAGVMAEPTVSVCSLKGNCTLVVASDGIWEYLTPENVAKLVSMSAEDVVKLRKSAADVEEFLSRGTKDFEERLSKEVENIFNASAEDVFELLTKCIAEAVKILNASTKNVENIIKTVKERLLSTYAKVFDKIISKLDKRTRKVEKILHEMMTDVRILMTSSEVVAKLLHRGTKHAVEILSKISKEVVNILSTTMELVKPAETAYDLCTIARGKFLKAHKSCDDLTAILVEPLPRST